MFVTRLFFPLFRYSETPSPMSPTPSPAGSVGSVGSMGSQGSNSSDIPPATTSSKMGPGMNMSTGGTMVPQRIYNMMNTYMTNSTYCLTSIDYWEQAETLSQENQGISLTFFFTSSCKLLDYYVMFTLYHKIPKWYEGTVCQYLLLRSIWILLNISCDDIVNIDA